MNPMADISTELFAKILNDSCDGITIADAQRRSFPLIYANQGFERLTGYTSGEVIGKNYRVILQGADTKQPEIAAIRTAISKGEGCVVTLRNYRKDGSMFWNELSISPVRDAAGKLTHFFGIQKDVTDKVLLEQQLTDLTNTDALVGISNRRHFDQRFADLLVVAKRIHSGMSVLMIDLDHFKQFNDRYGHAAGDECLRMVAACIKKSFIRTSDCVARYGGEEFATVSFSTSIDTLRRHAHRLCEQVRALNIKHDDSPHGVVTVSIGGIHRLPNRDATQELFVELASQELLVAKNNGRNCVSIIR
jgi:diguanylate cyclase (GGDEF)-like protein/PAS domain S-box-containing protein